MRRVRLSLQLDVSGTVAWSAARRTHTSGSRGDRHGWRCDSGWRERCARTGAGSPPNDGTAPPAAAEPPDAAELRRHFRAALAHQQRVRTEYSLSAIAAEISRTSPVSQPSLSRFLNGDAVTSPRRLPPCLSLSHPSLRGAQASAALACAGGGRSAGSSCRRRQECWPEPWPRPARRYTRCCTRRYTRRIASTLVASTARR